MNISNNNQLQLSQNIGASWKGFALEEIIRKHQAEQDECYFWTTQSHAGLDLLITKDGQRLGYEFKYADAPKITKSMRIAIEDLQLDSLTVVYPGTKSFTMDEKITTFGLHSSAN